MARTSFGIDLCRQLRAVCNKLDEGAQGDNSLIAARRDAASSRSSVQSASRRLPSDAYGDAAGCEDDELEIIASDVDA